MRSTFWREIPFFFALPAIMWQLLFLCIPLAFVVYTSLQQTVVDAPWYALTLSHYGALFTMVHAIILIHSLVLAGVTALLCLGIGYPVAYFLALRVRRWRMILLFLLTLPFWTNFLTQAYAWFFVLERHGLINSILQTLHFISGPLSLAHNRFAVLCVMIYCYLPFMIMPIYSVLQKVDYLLLEASQDLGATKRQTFTHITLPLSRAGIQTGLLLVFIPAFGEFVIPILMGGSRHLYVGSTITHYFLEARSEQLGAAFTCVSAAVLFGVVLLCLWYMRSMYRAVRRR